MPGESPAKRKIETDESSSLKRTKSIGHEDLKTTIINEVKQIFEDRIARLESRVKFLEDELDLEENESKGVDSKNAVEKEEKPSENGPVSIQKKSPPPLPPRVTFGKPPFQFNSNNGNNKANDAKVEAKLIKSSPNPVFGATTSFGNMNNKQDPVVQNSQKTTTPTPTPTPSFGTFGSKSRFGNAFQESLKQKSFLDSSDNSTDSSGARVDSKDESQATNTTQQFKQVDLNPVEQSTGEEDERSLFNCTAKLFELQLANITEGWKERGVGPLHLNQSVHDSSQVRIVMRSQGLLKVILNYKIQRTTEVLEGLEASLAPEKYIRFNSVSEGKPIQYLLKFTNQQVRDDLIKNINDLKSKM
ncbi:hypothetical protein CORT_0B05310 [Candida orthopsilosis Co 90-125]|uniref:RanBD1 domain-containing protein n=1 Tax=Candida orthopsilosis (strain 90-125) TaxID=1136231 RepID=H8WZP4_CANO9|nr:hypothetical protein CORT_0B05310 [Candida orthopsilosis Co 90-125]CCG22239.1 hypothetical protein CORT_0B05310 [Candida orthopsilosis Co 90-125]